MHEPLPRPGTPSSQAPALRHVLPPTNPVRGLWGVCTLASAAAAVSPFLLPHQVAAYCGALGTIALLLCVALGAVGAGSLHHAVLDGDVLVWPTTRGLREFDLARLRSVDGRRLSTLERRVDVLALVDEAGRTLDLTADRGFPRGRTRHKALLHVLHSRVADRVAAGQVRDVTAGALVVLGLPPGSVRTTKVPRGTYAKPLVVGLPLLAVLVSVLVLYVHLLSLVGLAKPWS